MELDKLLWEAMEVGATDLHLRAGAVPMARIDKAMQPLSEYPALTAADSRELAEWIVRDHGIDLNTSEELDIGYSVRDLGRFRVNIFTHGGQIGIVLRIMPPEPKGIDELHLPNVLSAISEEERGLVLVTGVTGSGKSTTLAAMIDHINRHKQRHIITIEDPIEYVHSDRNSLVTQRQLGIDTQDFAAALRAALRQDPDVILIGEMRDKETIDAAILAAETGHLVFSTLHTMDATETLNRILATYPPFQQEQMRTQLADVLRAIVSQRLMPRCDGEGLVPAVEVLINTQFVSECIRDLKKTGRIREAMAEGGRQYGMQTFDQSLLALVQSDLIDQDTAMAAATRPNDLALQLRGIVSSMDARDAELGAQVSQAGGLRTI